MTSSNNQCITQNGNLQVKNKKTINSKINAICYIYNKGLKYKVILLENQRTCLPNSVDINRVDNASLFLMFDTPSEWTQRDLTFYQLDLIIC